MTAPEMSNIRNICDRNNTAASQSVMTMIERAGRQIGDRKQQPTRAVLVVADDDGMVEYWAAGVRIFDAVGLLELGKLEPISDTEDC